MKGPVRPAGRAVDPFMVLDGPVDGAPLVSDDGEDEVVDFGHLDDEHPDDRAPRLGAEAAYEQAVDDDVTHDVDAGGTLGRASADRRRWRP